MIFTNHCSVSFYHSLHLGMPGRHNTPLLFFSDFSARFLDWLFRFLHCATQKPFFTQFGHIQSKKHVGLFKLYPTSLSCHCSWHVENLQEISHCFYGEIRLLPLLYTTPYVPLRSLKAVSSIPRDVYRQIPLRKSPKSQHRSAQIYGLCRPMHWPTMEVPACRRWYMCHEALCVPQLCVTLFIDRRLHQYGLSHIRSHAASYSCCFRLYVLFLNKCPGSYFKWLQLELRGALTGVCVAAGSHRVAHWLKCLMFSSIRLQSHLFEEFLDPWLVVVEWWGTWSRKEVECPEEYTVSYKLKWNECQPTCTWNSSWIRLRIAALHIAEGDPNSPTIVSKSVQCCLCVYRDTSWWTTADISCLIDMKRTFFDGEDVWRYLLQDIAWMLSESHANHQVIMDSLHDHSHWSDGQNADFALFKLIKPTNLDIKDAACLHVVHILQHPASHQTTRSTQDKMVNAPKRPFHHSQWPNRAHWQRNPHNDVIKWIKARVHWRQKGSEDWEHCAVYDQKRSVLWRIDRKHSS